MAADPRPDAIGVTQHVCSECPAVFVGPPTSKTCSNACRSKRRRRKASQGSDFTERDHNAGDIQAAIEQAKEAALADLPAVARERLGAQLDPIIRENLSGDVLASIGNMVGRLLPMAEAALEAQLGAERLVTDSEGNPVIVDGEPLMLPDHQMRDKAIGHVFKATIHQPGLAPQPEAPEQAAIVVNFGGMPPPTGYVDGTAAPIELGMNERQCDVCERVKDVTEFVGGSSRCETCHEEQRARIQLAIEERTKPAG